MQLSPVSYFFGSHLILLLIMYHIIQCWVDYVLSLFLQSIRWIGVFEFDGIQIRGEKLRVKGNAGRTLYKLSFHTGMQAGSSYVAIATAPH